MLDFGIATALDARGTGTVTRPGVRIGTPDYMSPEHVRDGDPSPDWDLWAVGVIAFEMLTGRPPASRAAGSLERTGAVAGRPFAAAVGASPPADVPPGALPDAFRRFFGRVLSPNAIERPESARELLDAFDAALEASHALRI